MPSAPIAAGTRVRIVQTLLTAEERAPNLPEDTAALPYLLRVNGELVEPGELGKPGRVRTAIGRELEGIIEVVEPADEHTFGRPVPPLVRAATAIRRLKEELR